MDEHTEHLWYLTKSISKATKWWPQLLAIINSDIAINLFHVSQNIFICDENVLIMLGINIDFFLSPLILSPSPTPALLPPSLLLPPVPPCFFWLFEFYQELCS